MGYHRAAIELVVIALPEKSFEQASRNFMSFPVTVPLLLGGLKVCKPRTVR